MRWLIPALLLLVLTSCKGDRPCLDQRQTGSYTIWQQRCVAYSYEDENGDEVSTCDGYVSYPITYPLYTCFKYGTPEP